MKKYLDNSLSIDERINDLLSQMTDKEKVAQLDQYYSQEVFEFDQNTSMPIALIKDELFRALKNNGVGSFQIRDLSSKLTNELQRSVLEQSRLKIPALFMEEGLHSFHHRKATVFPQQITLASSFEPKLGQKMGRAIAQEAYSTGVRETLSPVLDLSRDPRYGRTEETYGEDVHLSCCFAKEVVRGLQGNDLKDPGSVASEPKHFVAYGNPIGGLNCAPSTMGKHDVHAYCLPVFEAAIKEAGALNVMCSYNSIDSVPVACDKELLTKVLKDDFNMRGFVRSDMTAIAMLETAHHVAKNHEEAILKAFKAGCSMQLYDFPHEEYQETLLKLKNEGKISEDEFNEGVRSVLRVKFLLGLFENPFVEENTEDKFMGSKEHLDISYEIAKKSLILLKNEDNILPLSETKYKKIAVIGPNGDTIQLGDYVSQHFDQKTRVKSIYQVLKERLNNKTEVTFEKGCNILDSYLKTIDSSWLFNKHDENGLDAEYFNNATMSGIPVVERVDKEINFNWIFSAPAANIDSKCFSVRWKTSLVPDRDIKGGNIGFTSSDSMRLFVDGNCIIDNWNTDHNIITMIPFDFISGKKYEIVIEYKNDARGANVVFGYNFGDEDENAAIQLAKESDLVLLCLGEDGLSCGENVDRAQIELPGKQSEFFNKIAKVNNNIILILQNGRPLAIPNEVNSSKAVLEAFLPGEKGASAIVDLLFGDFDPSGRLPISVPKSTGQIPCHYSRTRGGAAKYCDMSAYPLFSFGYGLSYTKFKYSNLQLEKQKIQFGENVNASITIENIGQRDGFTVPQLYIRDVTSSTVKPEKELADFNKVFLKKGEIKEVTFTVNSRSMRTLTQDLNWVLEEGSFELTLGENSSDSTHSTSFYLEKNN